MAEQQLESLENQLADTRSTLQRAKAGIDVLTVQKSSMENSSTQASTEYSKLKAANDSLQRERDRLLAEVAAQSETLKQQSKTIEDNQQLIQDLMLKKTQLANLMDEISTNERISTALTKDIQRLKTQRDEFSPQADYSRLKVARDSLQKERDLLKAEVGAADETLKQQNLKIAANNNQIQDLTLKQTQLANIAAEISTNESISSALAKEVQRLKTRRAELTAEITNLERTAAAREPGNAGTEPVDGENEE